MDWEVFGQGSKMTIHLFIQQTVYSAIPLSRVPSAGHFVRNMAFIIGLPALGHVLYVCV